jgi:hypothetical protein
MITEFMLLYLSSSAMLILLWKTNSLQASISTTLTTISVGLAGVFGALHYTDSMILTLIFLLTILVWRVIPHDNKDVWRKV